MLSPANIILNPGETLTLFCEAFGVPIPFINWRHNQGYVPEKCTSSSVNGIGELTCVDIQIEDIGTYSCEAFNNKWSTFATQESIVSFSRTGSVCPSGYFNNEARSQSECIPCFCFGRSTQCQSADLNIFNMPTHLGEYGTRLVGVHQDYDGNLQITKRQDISNWYYYQPLRNTATITKLTNQPGDGDGDDDNSVRFITIEARPYITLPEAYNGNQLKSYGGRIKYRISAHKPSPHTAIDDVPDIIVMGKHQSLHHKSRNDLSREPYVNARLTPDDWQKPSPGGLIPASREDIMMALDDIELILLRADSNNAGVNITDFTMESAQTYNIGFGAASLVEECTCPIGYKGRSCEKCADGFERHKSGPMNGTCIYKVTCPPMTYGDPSSGGDCNPCPCPLTNKGNQFGRSCSVGSRGNLVCDCLPGYEGPNCNYCAPNYIGNPWIVGDSCKPQTQHSCNPLGTSLVRPPYKCVCKENVQGRYCDQCKNGSFFLSNDFSHGCANCFCSGVSQQCMISNLRRKTTTVRFNAPQMVSQVKLYQSAPIGPADSMRYNAPIATDLQPELLRGEIGLNNLDGYQPYILYWSLPLSFTGDKVTSYGGFLTYELHVPEHGSLKKKAADVQLISDNSLTFHYFGDFKPTGNGKLKARVQLLEKEWQGPDGKPVSREHFLVALADVETILIKATYSVSTDVAAIVQASIDTADPYGDGPIAQHVEQCVCPTGYIGTSCEDCAPGYTRNLDGLYFGGCGLCDCNGHSNICHPETGVCYDCADNTDGPFCEKCKDGFEPDQNSNCIPTSGPTQCNCGSRGETQPCDSDGRCICEENIEGERYYGRCKTGTSGLNANNPVGYDGCYCSGVTNQCHDDDDYLRDRLPAPVFGEDYGGYTLVDLNAYQVIKDQFIPALSISQLKYVFTSPYNPIGELYWSLPALPGNRVRYYGGTLSLTQSFETEGYLEASSPGIAVILVGEDFSLFWINQTPIRSREALSYDVPLRESNWYFLHSLNEANREDFLSVLKNLKRVLVRATLSQNITSTSIADVSMDISSKVCMCPKGYTGTSCENCALGFYKDLNGYCRQCKCNGNDCQLNKNGIAVCNCRPPYSGPNCSAVENKMTEPTASVSPIYKEAYEGDRIELTCTTTGNPSPRITWQPLPISARQYHDLLIIERADFGDSGLYRCIASNSAGVSEDVAYVTVRPNPIYTKQTLNVLSLSPTIEEGQSTQIECTGTQNIPTETVDWIRQDGAALLANVRSESGILYINKAVPENQGVYICQTSPYSDVNPVLVNVTVLPITPLSQPNELM